MLSLLYSLFFVCVIINPSCVDMLILFSFSSKYYYYGRRCIFWRSCIYFIQFFNSQFWLFLSHHLASWSPRKKKYSASSNHRTMFRFRFQVSLPIIPLYVIFDYIWHTPDKLWQIHVIYLHFRHTHVFLKEIWRTCFKSFMFYWWFILCISILNLGIFFN